MKNQSTAHTKPKRLTISITNDSVDKLEQLRSLLEKRGNERLSIAEVMKRLTDDALAKELAKVK